VIVSAEKSKISKKKPDSPLKNNYELQSQLYDRLHKQSIHIQETKKWRELEKQQNDLEKCTFIPNLNKYSGVLNGSKTVRAMSNAGLTMYDTYSKKSKIRKFR
jgi:hypothetical protein